MPTSSRLSSICQTLLTKCLTSLNGSPDGLGDEDVVHELRVATKTAKQSISFTKVLISGRKWRELIGGTTKMRSS